MAVISQLFLTNFRSFQELNLQLSPGIIVFHGDNAQGKTTLLEAIYLLAIARSFRAENEREVVNFDAAKRGEQGLVGGLILQEDEPISVYVGYQSVILSGSGISSSEDNNSIGYSVRKQIRVNKIPRTSSQLIGQVSAVLFSAEDIDLVYGSPARRRRFLNILISQADSAYVSSLQRYQRVIQQRNQLLKSIRENRSEIGELEYWDEQLVSEGTQIIVKRQLCMSTLSELCLEHHKSLGESDTCFQIEYMPSVKPGRNESETSTYFSESLNDLRKREIRSATTLIGPHRDDFSMMDGVRDLGTFSSRGEARTSALILRLAEASYLSDRRGDPPIVLLDDVLSEMDVNRRTRVMAKLRDYPQSIITTTDEGIVRDYFREAASYFLVEQGVVKSA